MNNLLKYFAAFILACLVPTLAIVLFFIILSLFHGDSFDWPEMFSLGGAVGFVAGMHVLVLGIPTFLVLQAKSHIQWWSPILAGFILGCVPIGIYAFPFTFSKHSSSHWNGEEMVSTVVDGVPTMEGWFDYAGAILTMGFLAL